LFGIKENFYETESELEDYLHKPIVPHKTDPIVFFIYFNMNIVCHYIIYQLYYIGAWADLSASCQYGTGLFGDPR
jgi:hypothetical protein